VILAKIQDAFVVPRAFVFLTGDLRAAVFLARCVELASQSPDGVFSRSVKEWEEDLLISRHQLESIRRKTERWVKTSLHRDFGTGTTMNFIVDFEQLKNDLGGKP